MKERRKLLEACETALALLKDFNNSKILAGAFLAEAVLAEAIEEAKRGPK